MKILTVISNYNEGKQILNTIRDFQENAGIASDLLVIDNCSSDSSLELIKGSGVDYLWHPVNTGGSAGVIKTSLLYAHLHDYDVYCHMDGDNQHYAAELGKLVEEIKSGRADIVIGSRFIRKEGFQSFWVRRIGIRTFSTLLSLITDYHVTDITSGFRAYNRTAISFLAKKFKTRYDVCLQLLLLAYYGGLKVVETPVIMKPRVSGTSEVNIFNALKFPFYTSVLILTTTLNYKWIRGLSDAN